MRVEVSELMGGRASGVSVQWEGGQFVFIVAERGLVGCGIFSVEVMDEFDMAGAIAKGTRERPLVVPEDLLGAEMVDVSEKACNMGIEVGMTGAQALEVLLEG